MRVRRWLDGPRPWRWAAVLAVVVGAPALWFGLQADDHLLHANVRGGAAWRAMQTAPWDLFHFYGDASPAEVIDRGLAGWYANPDGHARLFRPLTSLTHAAELSLWPDRPAWMHLHSLLWYAALCALAAALYRRLIAGWAAGLAALWFVIDYTHAAPMTWIANRNALIAGVFGLAALALHHRHRADGSRGARWAAAGCLVLAFAGGEVALAACAYLFAYAVCLERGGAARRLATLWPYAVVGIAWLALYAAGGYGVRGSGAYLDPVSRTREFLAALPVHAPLQLSGELGGPTPDGWMLWSPDTRAVLLVMALATCALAAVALAPLLRRDPVARFFGLGAVLAVIPVCAAFPMSRLTLVPGFGLIGLIAQLVHAWRERAPWLPRARARRWVTATFAVVAGGSHLVLSPPLLLLAQRQIEVVERETARLDRGLPAAGLDGRHLVIVNAPDPLLALYLLPQRTTRGDSLPASMVWLGDGTHELQLARRDDRTVIVTDPRGFYGDGFSALGRPADLPMPAGTEVALGGATVRVLRDDRGTPTEVAFTFAEPLDAPSLEWRMWDGDTLVAFTPPPAGTTVTVPARRHPLLDPWRYW